MKIQFIFLWSRPFISSFSFAVQFRNFHNEWNFTNFILQCDKSECGGEGGMAFDIRSKMIAMFYVQNYTNLHTIKLANVQRYISLFRISTLFDFRGNLSDIK
jgi:hypothetical protein